LESTSLAALFHHRWAVPILAELHRSGGARFVTLAHRLGASEGALRQALEALIAAARVMRNPGYGHPLRPEYLLAPGGEGVGRTCLALVEVLRDGGLADVAARKWPLPVLHALGPRQARYSELRQSLPGITDRALAAALKELLAAGMVARTVVDAHPPAVMYARTAAGGAVGGALEVLAGALGGDAGDGR
jgi:DNA-binding HxlR family transcriptional regulator